MAARAARASRWPRENDLAAPVDRVEDLACDRVDVGDALADDRDAALRRGQHDAVVALLVDAERPVDRAVRSISTVTGPSGVRTTRCGTTRPSKMQRAAKLTSPMPGFRRMPSGPSTLAAS